MKIIKEGLKQNDGIRFICQHCHCEFICYEDEYYKKEDKVCLTYPPQNELITSCPMCHKICRTYKSAEVDVGCLVVKGKYNTSLTGTCSEESLKKYVKAENIK